MPILKWHVDPPLPAILAPPLRLPGASKEALNCVFAAVGLGAPVLVPSRAGVPRTVRGVCPLPIGLPFSSNAGSKIRDCEPDPLSDALLFSLLDVNLSCVLGTNVLRNALNVIGVSIVSANSHWRSL